MDASEILGDLNLKAFSKVAKRRTRRSDGWNQAEGGRGREEGGKREGGGRLHSGGLNRREKKGHTIRSQDRMPLNEYRFKPRLRLLLLLFYSISH